MPGSGKTTLISNIIEAYRIKGIDACTVREAVYYSIPKMGIAKILPQKAENKVINLLFRYSGMKANSLESFSNQNPYLIEFIKMIQVERGFSKNEIRMVTGWLDDLFAQYELFNNHLTDDMKVVFDEGFSQRIITLFGYGFGGVNEKGIKSYIEAIPLPKAIYYINANVEVCLERMKKRGYPDRLKGKSESEILAVLKNCRECVMYALSIYEVKRIPVYVINNSASIDISIYGIADQIIR